MANILALKIGFMSFINYKNKKKQEYNTPLFINNKEE